HDEGTHAELGLLVNLVIGHIGAAPGAAVPRDDLPLPVEGLSARVAGGAVVHDPPVGGPRKRPVECLPETRRVRIVPPRHEVSGRAPGATVDPAARGGAAVVAQLGKPGELLARLARHLTWVLRIPQVFERFAGILPRQLLG